MKRLMFLAAVALTSTTTIAGELQCNQKQTYCVVESKRLTVGDEVAIVNDDKEVVALAEVAGMKGRKRRINITKKHGSIKRNHRAQYMPNGPSTFYKTHRRYRKRSRIQGGALLGLTRINIGTEAVAYGADVFGQYHWKKGILAVGRGEFFTAEGTVASQDEDYVEESYSLYGMNFLAGIAYKVFRKSPIAVRPEVSLGLTYVSVSSTGSAYPKSLEKIGNGVGIAARFGTDFIYTRMGDWQPMASLAFSKIHNARGTTLGFGVMRSLK